MAELNTRIILRNDTADNWATEAGKATALKAGEAAVEIINGKAKLKVATVDNQTFEAAPYVGGAEANVFQVELEANETDIENAIDAVVGDTELAVGDIAIVKAGIAGDKASYTSYVWDGNNWVATEGNYSAANVYTNSKITLAGDYGKDSRGDAITSIGNLRIGGEIAAGTSLQSLLMDMLSQRLQPSKTNPSATIILTNGGNNGANVEAEIGSTYTPKYRTTFSAGSFTYGPATGVTATAASVAFGTDSNKVPDVAATIGAGSLSGATGTLPGYVVPDGTARKLYLNYGWTASTGTPVDNLGDPATNADSLKISATSNQSVKSSHTVTGIRKMFGGSSTATTRPTMNSNLIRNLASNKKSGTGTFDVTIAEGANFAIIAVPAGRTVTKVEDGNAFGTDIFSEFESPITVSVGGADATADSIGAYATNYNVYVYAPKSSLSANTYTVHIA